MALAVLSIAVTPVNEVGKYLVRKIKTGYHYVTEYNLYLSKFQEELCQLQGKIEDVKKLIEKAGREFREPSKEITEWLQRAQNVEKECMAVTSDTSMDNTCLSGLHNLSSRGKRCKQILKLTTDISDLQKNGIFTVLAHDIPAQAVVPMGRRGIVENILSRERIMEDVMKALEDEEIRSIGVHGMGGIGKTTLVCRINNKLRVSPLFKKVIMITVSRDPNMKMIQDQIAERLDMELLQQDMATRADRLFEKLKSEESVLIILDDVWKPMELGEIGLPHSIEQMPCKFMVTTRNADVCTRMKVQKVIKMGTLSDGEAWNLFTDFAGHVVVELPNLEPIARKIVRRCKGSPLAIATLGSTLSMEKEQFVWDNALQVLEDPNAMRLEGIMPEVFTSLTWSYDHLSDKPNVQLCFLYCCLFPEDHNISLTDLRNYGIGESFLRTRTTLEDAGKELFCYIKILKDCCLLLDGDRIGSVKMHDVVRDVAILIASSRKDGFLVNVGGGSKYLPEVDKLHTYKRISFMNNEDNVLPSALECPCLRSLLVRGHGYPLEEQDISFEGLKSLVVLDMSQGNVSIPLSVSQLENLRTLYLDGCNIFNKIYILGELTKLEVLSMSRSVIGELPVDIGNLINLKFLDLSGASIEFVAPNVFSKLLYMEELYMWGSFKEWGTIGDGGRRNAEFTELLALPRLTLLKVQAIHSFVREEWSQSCWVNKLEHFRICASLRREYAYYNNDNNKVQIGKANLGKHWISDLLSSSRKNLDLNLHECSGFKSVTDLNANASFNHLEHLRVEACHEIENITVANRMIPHDSFGILKVLSLTNLGRLERILDGVTSSRKFFGKLEDLYMDTCPKIRTIFPSNLLFTEERLQNLKRVKVERCNQVQHVFKTGIAKAPEIQSIGATHAEIALLSGIAEISLYGLPKLKSIWNGVMPGGSFQGLKSLHVVNCPRLKYLLSSSVAGWLQNVEDINIQDCGALETVIHEETEGTSFFPRCRSLTIQSCPRLKSIFSFGAAGHLQQLSRLSISHCDGLRQLFGNGEEGRAIQHNCLLPEIKYLELRDLKSLTRFHQDNLPIRGPLEEIRVYVCPNLRRLPLLTVSALKYIRAEDIWFSRLELEDESPPSKLQPFYPSVFGDSSALSFHGRAEKSEDLLWEVAGLWLDDSTSQLKATTQFRGLLSGTTWDTSIGNVIHSGVVACFVKFLTRDEHTELQSEAAWILANIASRSSYYTNVVIDHGTVPMFVKLLNSFNDDSREHAIWALGNVAADSPECRDLVLRHGALIPLLAQLNDCAKVSILRNALWTISNLFAVLPPPPFKQMKLAVPALQGLLHSNNERVCVDACRIISSITSGNKKTIQLVIAVNIVAPLVQLLETAEFHIKKEAARALSYATCHGTRKQIKHLVKKGCIKPFCDLLDSSDSVTHLLCLEGLVNILKVGETGGMEVINRYVRIIDGYGGFKKIADLEGHNNSESQQKAVGVLKSYHLEMYTSPPDDAGESSLSESNSVEKGLSSTEMEYPASKGAKSYKQGVSFLDELISHGSNGQRKRNQIDLNSPPLTPYLTDSWSNASVKVDKNCLDSKPELNTVPKDCGRTGADDPLSMLIDHNCPPSSSIELAKDSHVIGASEQEWHFLDTKSNASMRVDLNCVPSSSTDQDGYVIGNSGNASVKDNHESEYIYLNSIPYGVTGGSSSTATTSTRDEVWNDQSKNQTLSCKHECKESKAVTIQVQVSSTKQESSSEYTISESIKILDAVVKDMSIAMRTYFRAVKLFQEQGWRESFLSMSDARRKDFIMGINDGEI